MRAYLPAYELQRPASLDEALRLLASAPGEWRPFAGGTDLMVLLEAGKLEHRKFFSIWHLDELRGIEETIEHITLGALTTYTELQSNETMRREFPMLCVAASETGAIAIQNRGTLGGNIANASPAADSPPALIVYGAELELVSARGARWIAYEGFHTAYKQMRMEPDELISRIRLPRASAGDNWKQYYRKVGTRKAQAISKICFAGAARLGDGQIEEARISMGSVAPTVVSCTKTASILRGRRVNKETIGAAQGEMKKEIVPIDDLRSTADYRLQVSLNLLEDFLLSLER
ncbi:MAG: xanthine dehydrogenase family protein subunit M [Pyrinomonadaceae bacterium]|nr:xanthine dehydrogenase family protein subunit M [Pyrinomonadaceae bacterium]